MTDSSLLQDFVAETVEHLEEADLTAYYALQKDPARLHIGTTPTPFPQPVKNPEGFLHRGNLDESNAHVRLPPR